MTQDWLLVETLGDQPMVVAQGRQMKNFIPIAVFLRRNPNLPAIQTAIVETVSTGTGLASITPKSKRVIRTEPVQMSDGRIHAVHVWCGPVDGEPPERPIPGPFKWDVTLGEGSATLEYFVNAGMDPATESSSGRAFAEDIPSRSFNRDEAKALSWTIDAAPDRTFCATWDFPDKQGTFRRVGWCARTLMEPADDGKEHLIARAMNLVEHVTDAALPPDAFADRILHGLAQPGVYRAVADINNWTLLKWIDDPCPFFNWRDARMHPDDREHLAEQMAEELGLGATHAVFRLPGNTDGEWVPMHVTINRLELESGVYGGLVTLRLPTDDELSDAGLERSGPVPD
ncbi:MAG: PAS domain-containing protein [Mycobacterium sp.]